VIWGGLLTGVIVALSIWIFDIESPTRIAILALGVGAAVSLYNSFLLQSWHSPRRGTGWGAGTKGQREADESEVSDVEDEV
jgi:ABC-type enterobactin transport system permease subunit